MPARTARGAVRTLARVASVLLGAVAFAVVALWALARTHWVSDRLAQELERALSREGIVASFRIRLESPWRFELDDVRVESQDAGPPTLEVPRVVVRPRLVALLMGRLEASSILVDAPTLRISGEGGTAGDNSWRRVRELVTGSWPFRRLTLRDGRMEGTWQSMRVVIGGIDVEARAGGVGGRWRLRVGQGRSEQLGQAGGHHDALCALDATGRVGERTVSVDRVQARGVMDAGPGFVACIPTEGDTNQVTLTATDASIDLDSEKSATAARGHVIARAPLAPLERTGRARGIRGWARVDVDVRFAAGWRLPEVRGTAEAHDIRAGEFAVARVIEASGSLEQELLRIPEASVETTAGRLRLSDVELRPLADGSPIRGRVEGGPLRFEEFLRAMQVARRPHVMWAIDELRWGEIVGTLSPFVLSGDFGARTGRFTVFDGPCDVKRCQRVWGFARSQIDARATLTADAFELDDVRATLSGGDARAARVVIGFHDQIRVDGARGRVDLVRDSPLADLETEGQLRVEARVFGRLGDPTVDFAGSVDGFVLDRHPLGDVTSVRGSYGHKLLSFFEIHARKRGSDYSVPSLRIAFGPSGRLDVDLLVAADEFGIRDLLSLARLDERPGFASFDGSLRAPRARVRYVHGGPEDVLRHGTIFVEADALLTAPKAFGAYFDEGAVDVSVRWWDRSAGLAGVDIDLRALALRDRGPTGDASEAGSVFASGSLVGGEIRAAATAQSLPLNKAIAMTGLTSPVPGSASGLVHAVGTIDALAVDADVDVTPVRVRGVRYGPSTLHVETVLGERATPHVAVRGSLLGGEVELGQLIVDNHVLRGRASARELRIGPLLNGRVGSPTEVQASLSGELTIDSFDLRDATTARARFVPSALSARMGEKTARLRPTGAAIVLAGDSIVLPPIELQLSVPAGRTGRAFIHGQVDSLTDEPRLELTLELPPADLALLVGVVPDLVRASGTLSGALRIRGLLRMPVFEGELRIRGEKATVAWIPGELHDVDLDMTVDRHELRLQHALAKLGDGLVDVAGACPAVGPLVGMANLTLHARRVHLPIAKGIDTTFDANAHALVDLRRLFRGGAHAVVVTGHAAVSELVYRRSLDPAADLTGITTWAARARRHETNPPYDPARDLVDFGIVLHALAPVLVDDDVAKVGFLPQGEFRLGGTNQRPSLLGRLVSVPGGKLRIRGISFDVEHAILDFDDPLHISPRIEVVGTTEYRRLTAFEAPMTFVSPSGGRGAQAWRIRLNVVGRERDIDVRLSSDPALGQTDIVLLLTLGVTRPELEAMQALGPFQATAGIETLAGLGGAERIVQSVIPIDELRFGALYSPLTLVIIPDVTVGKRIGKRLAATLTTSFSYGAPFDHIVNGTVSWSLGRDVWFEALWQNVTPAPVYPVGDFGVGVRWGREFR